jgi:hypothetical protein
MITIRQQITPPSKPAVFLTPVSVGLGGSSANGSDFRTVKTTDITGAQSWTNHFISVPTIGVSVANNAPSTLDFSDFLNRISKEQGYA